MKRLYDVMMVSETVLIYVNAENEEEAIAKATAHDAMSDPDVQVNEWNRTRHEPFRFKSSSAPLGAALPPEVLFCAPYED